MTHPLNAKPKAWGADQLTTFMDSARSNAFASFDNLPMAKRMIAIDSAFDAFITEFHEPEDMVAAALILRGHSALRAAAQLGLSGQVPECYMLLRGALEHALYAFRAASATELAQVWLERHDGPETRRRCSSEFSPRKIFPDLRARDPHTGFVAGELYELLIDLGAHPNAKGVLTTMEHAVEGDIESFSFSYLAGDSPILRLALQSWCQTGICCLDLAGIALPRRFSEMEFSARLSPLRTGL